jgi:diguanylate cyclase (GGDEF)-like protein
LLVVLKLRHALAAAAVAVTIVPAGLPTGPALASIDGEQAVRSIATEAADLLEQELELVTLANPANTPSPTRMTEVLAQLRSIDGQGQAALVQLRGLGVELTPAIEATLERQPADDLTGSPSAVSRLPQAVTYEAAIEDLLRIAATPGAVGPVGDSSGGTSSALLLIAAASLITLGAAALTNTLWRRPTSDDLEALGWSDGLTGLANRRRLDHDIDAHPDHWPTTVCMVQVDHFKSITDAHGQHAGDEILKRLGAVLAHHVRLDDVVYRYADDEFCVLLPGANADSARVVAERIVEAAHSIDLPGGANITVSVGIAGPVDGEVGGAIVHADRALDLAKERGRDRAVHADEDTFASA